MVPPHRPAPPVGLPRLLLLLPGLLGQLRRIDVDPAFRVPRQDELEQAQAALLDAFRAQGLAGQSNRLARRGRDQHKRHDLRPIGLGDALDGEHGLSLCHHVYPDHAADCDELHRAQQRITRMLEHAGIALDSFTLVMDQGAAAGANTLDLAAHGLGWNTALRWR